MNTSEACNGCSHQSSSQPLLSDALFQMFQFYLGITESVFGLLGLALNVINLILFLRLGFADTTNISMSGLAVANVGVSLTMLGYGALNNPLVIGTVTNTDTLLAVRVLALATSHLLFSRAAGLITAFISVERLLCVAWPLHVKALVTKQRTIFVIFGVYIFMASCQIPTWLSNMAGQKLNSLWNVTDVGIVRIKNAEELQNITVTITVGVQMSSFAVVVITTACLTNVLRRVADWRKVNSHASGRDKKLVTMVILISVVFIVCTLPSVLANAATSFFQEFRLQGREKNLFIVTNGVSFTCQLINAVLNTFVYWKMSSRFRDAMRAVFVCQTIKS